MVMLNGTVVAYRTVYDNSTAGGSLTIERWMMLTVN